jgi:hypothetical protein
MVLGRHLIRFAMTQPIPLFPHRHQGRITLLALVAALAVMGLLWSTDEPEPAHPQWASVTRALESDAWPLVTAARYDPANHFVLVDVHPSVTPEVAVRLACEGIRTLVDEVDSAAGFALYARPDHVIVHRDDCAD